MVTDVDMEHEIYGGLLFTLSMGTCFMGIPPASQVKAKLFSYISVYHYDMSASE